MKNDEIVSLGNSIFSIPFSCNIGANIEYFIFKSDYYSLDEDRIKYVFVEDWNDHYYQAEEEFELSCTGEIGLEYNTSISDIIGLKDRKIEDIVADIKISFNDLEIKII